MAINTQQESNEDMSNSKASARDLIISLIRDFVESKAGGPDFNRFFDDVVAKSTPDLDVVMKAGIDTFKAKEEKYTGLDTSGITHFDLTREVIRAGSSLVTRRDELLNVYDELYDLNASQKFTLEGKIRDLSVQRLDILLKSETERKALLRGVFPTGAPELKKMEDVFENILGTGYDWLSDEEKEALSNYYHTGFADQEVLFRIIERSADTRQKQRLLEVFVPTLPLQKLIDLGIVGKDQADDIIFDHLKKKYPALPDARKREFVSYVKKNDFVVSTRQFTADPANLQKILEDDGLKGLFHDMGRLTDEAAADAATAAPENRERGKEKVLQRIKKEFEECKGRLDLTNFGENTVLHGVMYEKGIEKKLYLLIESIDDDGNFVVKDLTHDRGVYDRNSVQGHRIEERDMMNILSHFSLDPNHGEILQAEDLNTRVKEGSVLEYKHASNIATLSDLLSNLNHEDPKGTEYGMKPGMVFGFEREGGIGDVAVCRIQEINEQAGTITMSNANGAFTFKEFFESFKSQKGKRMAVMDSVETMLNALKNNKDVKGFGDIVYDKEKNRFVPKNQEKNPDHPGVSYFVGSDKTALKIESIKGDIIHAVIGEYDEKATKNSPKGTFTETTNQQAFKIEDFYYYIAKKKLEPKIFNEDVKVTHAAGDEKLKEKFSISKFLLGMQNWATISMSFKTLKDSMIKTLKDNNELIAAKFTQKFSWLLPEGMKSDLNSKIEGIEKGKMGEKITQLEGKIEAEAMEYVLKILKTRNAYPHEIEACMMYVIKKNGTLYPGILYPYKGSYIWYEKLGGKVGDALYNEFYEENLKAGKACSEEELVEKLLRKQASGALRPRRRSTIGKEFASNYLTGRNDAKKNGKEDLDTSKNTRDGREAECLAALKNGKVNYVIGALESTLDKGGKPEEKCKIPFMLVMSGITKRMNENDTAALGRFANNYFIPILSCAGRPGDSDLFERVVKSIAVRMKDTSMENDVSAIISMKNRAAKEGDILDVCEKFWNNHGKKISMKLLTNDYQMKRWADEDPDIKDYLGKVGLITTYGPFTGDKANGNLGNSVYNADNSFLLIAGGFDYLNKIMGNQITGKRGPNDPISVKGFDSAITVLNNLRNEKGKMSDDDVRKCFIEMNNTWAEYLLVRGIAYEDLLMSEWGRRLIKTGIWIPKRAQLQSPFLTRATLKDGLFQQHIEEAYARFIRGDFEKNFDEKQRIANDTKIRVDNIMRQRFTKERAAAEKKSKNMKSRPAFDPSFFTADDYDDEFSQAA